MPIAIQLKDADSPDSVKRNDHLSRVLDAMTGNGTPKDRLRQRTIHSTNNKPAITERKVNALSGRGQNHNGVEESLAAGVFRTVLEKACSTKDGVLLRTICRKQSKSRGSIPIRSAVIFCGQLYKLSIVILTSLFRRQLILFI